jgi:uncharacterized protein YunC (DUF1805 family)
MKHGFSTKLKCYFLFLVSLIPFIYSCAHSLPPKPAINERIRIAVIPASNKTIDQKIAEMLTTALKKEDYFVIVERNRINRVFNEQKIQYSGLINEDTLTKLGKSLEAQYIILGELIHTEKDQSSTSVSIGIYTTTISAKIIDFKENKMIAVASKTGRSFTGGLGVDVVSQGKTKKELVGVQRTGDDMFNAAIRSTTEKLASAMINAVYNKNERYIEADITPSMKIETWTRNLPENMYSQAFGKLFLAPYEVVWSALLKYFNKDIMTSDRQKGIIITKAFEQGGTLDKRQVFILIEQDKLGCTKVTLKGFCYDYNYNARPGDCPNIRTPGTPEEKFAKYKGTCYNIWSNSRLCSDVYIGKITKHIENEFKKQSR